MEEEEPNLTKVPHNYPICLNRQCPKASTCLHQLVEQEVADDIKFWLVISPKYQATLKGDCPHYRSNAKVRFAKGFMNILDNLPHKQMIQVTSHLIAHFSQRSYYRIRKGERLLKPAEQKTVIAIFKTCGVTGKLDFDSYVEGIEW